MTDAARNQRQALIIGAGGRICALPLSHVIETMRPLPVEPIQGVPFFVQGVSIIRGIPTPVISLGAVLGAGDDAAERFITLRLDDKQVALAVNAVLGVRELDPTLEALPPLLQGASKYATETISTLDRHLLTVLQTGWELPDEVWKALTVAEAVS
jgi:purine-binding chemotaxis protein CheW